MLALVLLGIGFGADVLSQHKNSMIEMLWDLQSEDSGGEPVEQHGNE